MAYTPSNNFIFVANLSYTPTGDFVFGTPIVVGSPSGDINALIGDVTGGFVGDFTATTGQTAIISATLDGLSSQFIARYYDFGGQLSATLADVVGGMIGNYDSNILNFTTLKTCGLVENATKSTGKLESPQEQASFKRVKVNAIQQDGSFLIPQLCFVAENGTRSDYKLVSTQQDGTFIAGSACFVQEQGTFIDFALCLVSEQASAVDLYLCAIMEQMTKVYPDRWCAPIQDSGTSQHDILRLVYLEPDAPYDYTPSLDFTFTQNPNYQPSTDFELTFGKTGYVVEQHVIGVNSNWTCSSFTSATPKKIKRCVPVETARKPPRGKSPWIDLPPVDPPVDPPGGGSTVIIPTQEVYTMQNIITATLDDGVTAIHLGTANMSFDTDSTSWQFSSTLDDPAQVDLIKQNANGSAKIIYITINSVVWHMLVEKITTTRVYGKKSVSISGRGISALLSKPYVQPQTVNFGSLQTNQQIADLIAPNGWTVVWSAPVWNITAGAYGYSDKTPIEALSQFAKDMGLIIIPSTNSQTLEFKPRYPVEPWNFALVSPDFSIPDSVITGLTEEPVSSFQADAVFIHGYAIGGVQAKCRRNGTAGTKLLSTVSNALMTDALALRTLGKRLLAAQVPQPKIKSVTTFMDGTTVPFIGVSSFVAVTVDSVGTRGIVNAVSIEANHVTVSQTLTIGETTPNTWVAFKEILPKDPLLIATLSSTDGSTSLMALVDGGVVRVRGTGTVNNKYYIRSGEIVSSAPSVAVLSDIVIPI